MTRYRIAVIVGSLRQNSFNGRLADALARLAPPGFGLERLAIGTLPLYNQDDDADPAPAVRELRAAVAAAQGVLFVTPEYNRSFPGVLKNAIDHASRPFGSSAWAGKPAGVIGVSPGAAGTAMAQQHLRNVLAALDMPTLGTPELFVRMTDALIDPAGDFGATRKPAMQHWMNRYAAWVLLHAPPVRAAGVAARVDAAAAV